jgi:hypothetical protein
VKITRLKKTVAISGIALIFVFGVLAVSLAYEAMPAGPLDTGVSQYLVRTGPASLYARLVATGLQFETDYLTESPRPCSEACQITTSRFVELLKPPAAPRPAPAKVSLQLLKSALLL